MLRKRARINDQNGTWLLGLGACIVSATIVGGQIVRVFKRGAISESDITPLEQPLVASSEVVSETIEVVKTGYQDTSPAQQAYFNMLVSYLTTIVAARSITTILKNKRSVGPFRNMQFGNRHIHHFIPGLVLGFLSGGYAVVSPNDDGIPLVAIPFGVGLGLVMDESALLLRLEDNYWSKEGILSVQLALGSAALLGSAGLAINFLRKGEEIVLPS